MKSVMKIFSQPIAPKMTLAEMASAVLHGMGPLALVIGIAVLPSLHLSEAGFYMGLLALVSFMLLSFTAGQVAIIADELRRIRSKPHD